MRKDDAPRVADEWVVGRDVRLAGNDVECGAEDLALVQRPIEGFIVDHSPLQKRLRKSEQSVLQSRRKEHARRTLAQLTRTAVFSIRPRKSSLTRLSVADPPEQRTITTSLFAAKASIGTFSTGRRRREDNSASASERSRPELE